MLGTILKIGASTCIGAVATGAAVLIIRQKNEIRNTKATINLMEDRIKELESNLNAGFGASSCGNTFKFGVGTTTKDCPGNHSSDMEKPEDKEGKPDTEDLMASITEAATEILDGAHHIVKTILESDTASSIKSDVSKAFSKLAESDTVKQFTSGKAVTDLKGMAKEAHDKLHITLTSATEVMKQYKPSEKTKTGGEAETSGEAAKGSDTGSDTESDTGK